MMKAFEKGNVDSTKITGNFSGTKLLFRGIEIEFASNPCLLPIVQEGRF